MSVFTQELQSLPNFYSLKGVSEDEIVEAEKSLKLEFSKEYSDYLSEFGVASANGHEFTGICTSARLSVVDITLLERENNPDVPYDWYVIEQANIDGIVIWQNGQGKVFQTQTNCKPIMIAESFRGYIQK